MFRQFKPEDPSLETVTTLQNAADQVTGSRQYIDGIYQDCALQATHPWDADDLTQIGLVFAGLAFAHD